ncbi:MAG TPA: thioesterase family protein [Thermoanaerobaculia bacterium]|jgi:acyl-CoA thioesterase FadM
MLLLVRFVFVLLRSLVRRRIGPLDESVVRYTALPQDCDLNFHLNAGRFISFMDVSRVELIGRMRLLVRVLRRGWRPVVGAATVRYRRSIMPFERFDIRSRVIGWDEKWFYVEHILEKNGTFCASGYMRTVIRGRDGVVPPREVLALLHLENTPSPALPPFVADWAAAEDRR